MNNLTNETHNLLELNDEEKYHLRIILKEYLSSLHDRRVMTTISASLVLENIEKTERLYNKIKDLC